MERDDWNELLVLVDWCKVCWERPGRITEAEREITRIFVQVMAEYMGGDVTPVLAAANAVMALEIWGGDGRPPATFPPA